MIVACAMYAIAGVLIMGLPKVTGTLAGAQEHPIRQLIDGWGEFVPAVAVGGGAAVVGDADDAAGCARRPRPGGSRSRTGGAAAWTAILAGEALGAVVGVAIAMFWKPRRPILVATVLTLSAGVPAVLLGFAFPLWTVILAAFVMGIGFDLFGVLWMTTMQDEVPPESLSRVASYDALGSLMLGPLGLVLAGPATLLFGAHNALISLGVIAIVTAVFALAFPEVRQLEAKRPAAAEVVEAA